MRRPEFIEGRCPEFTEGSPYTRRKLAGRFFSRFFKGRILSSGIWTLAKFFDKKDLVGTWLSLVERCVRDAEVAGSNPVVPTISFLPRRSRIKSRSISPPATSFLNKPGTRFNAFLCPLKLSSQVYGMADI